LTAERRSRAIFSSSRTGPCFSDISVSDQCNTSTVSSASIGANYVNQTGVDIPLTGSKHFQVREMLNVGLTHIFFFLQCAFSGYSPE
jgi:hypothetical protein